MKTALVLLVVASSALAFGQATVGGGVLSSQPQILQLPSYPQHASIQSMGREQTLLEPTNLTYAQGERPLWEFASTKNEAVPLGDVARMLRKEHEMMKKAGKVWTN
jgi:hypothetical protein